MPVARACVNAPLVQAPGKPRNIDEVAISAAPSWLTFIPSNSDSRWVILEIATCRGPLGFDRPVVAIHDRNAAMGNRIHDRVNSGQDRILATVQGLAAEGTLTRQSAPMEPGPQIAPEDQMAPSISAPSNFAEFGFVIRKLAPRKSAPRKSTSSSAV